MTHVADWKKVIEHTPEYVAAPIIAKKLSVTSRYILLLAESGKIPCLRLGAKCVRFNLHDVGTALGVDLTGKKGGSRA